MPPESDRVPPSLRREVAERVQQLCEYCRCPGRGVLCCFLDSTAVTGKIDVWGWQATASDAPAAILEAAYDS
ncbi:hypothetical protein XM38_043340 [Halomicronema hongdechloris C2206]|uniref:Uncharacterized protein n=1 Tax=Halomicronema hongdechloris C2206 TaxID=1641165 RepID=A0A1Z3HSU6_9CYAN|nr:hypothetical protein [Halomicronema hongdechloris]ASC73369.1 hypothetical protein XM38_043340 [Halomicronema hongdechloris C2206]